MRTASSSRTIWSRSMYIRSVVMLAIFEQRSGSSLLFGVLHRIHSRHCHRTPRSHAVQLHNMHPISYIQRRHDIRLRLHDLLALRLC